MFFRLGTNDFVGGSNAEVIWTNDLMELNIKVCAVALCVFTCYRFGSPRVRYLAKM